MKRFLIILVSILVLLIAAVIIAVNVFLSEEKVREYAIKPIEENSTLSIDFDSFSAGVWGGIHVDLNGLSIVDSKYKRYKKMLLAENFRLSIPLSFLWTGELAVDNLFLEKADIFLEMQIQEEADQVKQTSDVDSVKGNTETSDLSLLSLLLPAIEMKHVNVNLWMEEQDISTSIIELNSSTYFALEHNEMELRSDIAIDSVRVSLADKNYSSTNQKLHVNLAANLEKKEFKLDGSHFVLMAIPGKISGDIVMLNSKPKADIRIEGKSILFERILENLKLDISQYIKKINGDLDYTVDLNYEENKPSLHYKAHIKAISATLKQDDATISNISGDISGDLEQVKFKKIKILAEKQKMTLDGSVKFKPSVIADMNFFLNADLSKLSKFNSYFPEGFQLHSGKIKTILAVNGEISKTKMPFIKGNADIQNIHFEMAGLPEKNMNVSSNIHFSSKQIQMKSFRFKSNNHDISATAKLNDYLNIIQVKGKKARLNASINGKKIDLSPYMQLEEKEEKVEKKEKLEKASNPLILLANLDVDLKANLDELIADHFNIEHIETSLENKNRNLKIEIKRADFYEGKIKGQSNIDYSSERIKTKHRFESDKINLNQLANSVLSSKDKLFGKFTAKGTIDLDFLGLDSVLSKSIQGKFSYLVEQAKLANLPMLKKLGSTLSIFNFDTLKAKKWDGFALIKDEKVILSKINMSNSEFDLTCKNGTYHFNGKINFPLEMKLSKSKSDEYRNRSAKMLKSFIDLLKDKNGRASIKPILLGTYNSPNLKLDWSDAEKKAKKSVEKKVKKEAKKLFKKWFN